MDDEGREPWIHDAETLDEEGEFWEVLIFLKHLFIELYVTETLYILVR
jgi:hypothetical protein